MPEKIFKPRKVINIHSHIARTDDVPAKVALWKEQGAVRTCVQALPRGCGWEIYYQNEHLEPLLCQYPDHIIGFAALHLAGEGDRPGVVAEWHARGFRGIKCIEPDQPYDADAYMPFYEEAAKYRMPILFHTGILSFPPDYRGACRIDHMRPARLDRIARSFPELPIIGAHLGTPWCDEAVGLALARPNIYFDLCGGSGLPQWGSRLKWCLAPFAGADWMRDDEHLALRLFRDKFLFGTDSALIERWVLRSEDVLDYLKIPAEIRENFYWKTAAGLLGI